MTDQNNPELPESDAVDMDSYNEGMADMFLKATEALRIAIREHHRGHSEHGQGDLSIMMMQYAALHVLREELETFLLMSAPMLNLEEIRQQCLIVWEQYRANGAGKDLLEMVEQGLVMGPEGEA